MFCASVKDRNLQTLYISMFSYLSLNMQACRLYSPKRWWVLLGLIHRLWHLIFRVQFFAIDTCISMRACYPR